LSPHPDFFWKTPSLRWMRSVHKKIHVKIVGYLTGDKILAKRRADSVKQYIIRKYPKMNSRRLEISGIGKPEKVKAGWKRFDLDDSMDIFKGGRL
jgi:hypothetical protein